MNTNERIVNILLERKVNSFLERTDEGIIGGGLRGLYQGVKKSFNKDYNPEASKQASIETKGIGHTAAQHTGRLAGRALGGALKTAGAAIKGGARGVYQGIKKSANPNYNPEAHKQASMERQGVVGAGAQKLGQLAGRGIGAAGGMIKRGFNKMMQRESSVYDRMTEMLLEARVEMFIQDRLDESTRYKREIQAGNLSDKSIRRLQSAEKQGKLEAPPETRLGPEFGPSSGRITGLARLKKRIAKSEKNKAKGKPYEYNLPKVEPKKLPQGPGKQTGPLEKRGIKINPEKPQKPQRGKS